jgi:N-acetylmuramoyl-L-alanine amidase
MACPPLLAAAATSIVIAGQPYDVGRPVVLWCDSDRGFNAYSEVCVEKERASASSCCETSFKRYGTRSGVRPQSLTDLQSTVRQLVLHHDGCVNSRSCFYSMHDTPRPDGRCGLSAHFMVDFDGTIYQTLDVEARAIHAGEANQISIGVEMCNRADASRNELDRLPPDYRTRAVRHVVINDHGYDAFDFRPEQYASVTALTKVLLRAFPRIAPMMPLRDGKPLLATLADPLSFSGIVGHFHVDRQQRKWDPGGFDWQILLDALHGFYLPVSIRGYDRLPDDNPARLTAAKTAALFNVEDRMAGSYPVGPGGIWDPGVYFPADAGGLVRAPAGGIVVAARLGRKPGAPTGFVLIRHDSESPQGKVRFFSLLGPLAPVDPDRPGPVSWLEKLTQNRAVVTSLKFGETALINEAVGAGDVVGLVTSDTPGRDGRDDPSGAQIRMEIFTTERLPEGFRRTFTYLDAIADGPVCRRGGIFRALGVDRASALEHAQIDHFLHTASLDNKQALRRFAVRMPHPWGDNATEQAFVAAPALAGLSPEERQRVYQRAVGQHTFWNQALSAHAGLPRDQVVYFHHPVTFLYSLAAARGGSLRPWPAADIVDGTVAPVAEDGRAAIEWLTGRAEGRRHPYRFGRLVHTGHATKPRGEIELVVLPPLQDR